MLHTWEIKRDAQIGKPHEITHTEDQDFDGT
jgi:hypothetical protein